MLNKHTIGVISFLLKLRSFYYLHAGQKHCLNYNLIVQYHFKLTNVSFFILLVVSGLQQT